jgi:hypothetical protein
VRELDQDFAKGCNIGLLPVLQNGNSDSVYRKGEGYWDSQNNFPLFKWGEEGPYDF